MPPAPWTTGSRITAASSSACARGELAHVRRPALIEARVEAVGRTLGEDVLGQHAGEQAVHAADRVAHGHRAGRVAVVAAADRQQARARSAPERALVLQAHLDRDLHRDRARSRRRTRARGPRARARSGARPARTAGSCVSPPNITCAILPELLARGAVERRVAVAVDRAPPRGHAVDQLAAVGQAQAHALRGDDRQRGQRCRQRAVWVPDALARRAPAVAPSRARTARLVRGGQADA